MGDEGRRGWPLALGAGVIALGLGIWLSPDRPADDAAILLRYADRLGGGDGFSYNDHERVLGASSGLWTLLIAGLRALGAPVVGAGLGLAVVAHAAAVTLTVRLGTRLGGAVAGVVAAAVLLTSSGFRGVILSGMESGLAAALGAGAVLVASRAAAAPAPDDAPVDGPTELPGPPTDDSVDGPGTSGDRAVEIGVGAVLGLALWNKLDAVSLAVAVGGAWWWVRRQPPLRMAATSAAVVAPYLVFCWVWFGSPIPQSATSKLGGRADAPGWSWDPTWAVVALRGLWPAALAAAVGLWWARRATDPGSGPRLAIHALVGWGLLHGAAVSLVPTGAEYPWYLTVLHVPLAVLAGLGGAAALDALRPGAGDRTGAPLPRWLAAAAALGLAVTVTYPLATSLRNTPPTTGQVRFDSQLPELVAWLEPRISEGDVLRSCYGGAALGLPAASIDDPCALTSDTPSGPVRWEITELRPDSPGPTWAPPADRCVARAASADPRRPDAERLVIVATGEAGPDGLCR